MCSFPVFAIWKKHGNKDEEKTENGRENQTFNPFKKLTHSQTNYKTYTLLKHTCTTPLHDHHCIRFGVFLLFFQKSQNKESVFYSVIPQNISALLKDGACIKFPSCQDRITFMGFNDQCWNLKWCRLQTQHCWLLFVCFFACDEIQLYCFGTYYIAVRKKLALFSWMNNLIPHQFRIKSSFYSQANAIHFHSITCI